MSQGLSQTNREKRNFQKQRERDKANKKAKDMRKGGKTKRSRFWKLDEEKNSENS